MNKLKKISSAIILSFALVSNVSAAKNTNDIKIEIDGKNVISDVAPFINNERTLVPIRVISENLGYNVNWDNNSRKVTVKNSSKTIELFIGKKNVSVNGVDNSIDVAPMIKNERTFVPLRFISESFDNDVKWDNNTRTVKINKKEIKVASILNDIDIRSTYKSIKPTSTLSKTKKVDDNNLTKLYYLNSFTNGNKSYSDINYIYKPQSSTNVNHNKSDFSGNLITTEDLHFKKYKNEQIEHIERLLRQIDIDKQNISTLNYNMETERIAIQKLQEELRLIKEPRTVQDKIHFLKINHDLTQKQDQMKFQIEFIEFSDKSYFNFRKYYLKLKNTSDERNFKMCLEECEDIFKIYEREYNNRILNDRLTGNIFERNYTKDMINLLYLDKTNNNKEKIVELNKRLIFLDSQIMYGRKPDSEFQMSTTTQKLLAEYDKSAKDDIENYHKPANSENNTNNNKSNADKESTDDVLKELTKI